MRRAADGNCERADWSDQVRHCCPAEPFFYRLWPAYGDIGGHQLVISFGVSSLKSCQRKSAIVFPTVTNIFTFELRNLGDECNELTGLTLT